MTHIRHHERKLLFTSGVIMLNGILAVSLSQGVIDFKVLGATFGVLACFFVIHGGLHKAGHEGEPFLLPLATLLSGIGLTMILRLKPNLFFFQAMWIGVGCLCFIISSFSFRNIEKIFGPI